ncbi:MAG: IS110 family transposase [Candidatus Kaiserbacteria bacterium]|nr:IS110 family transposase [Candidatus Kaiserbacteria bacterium]
MNDERNVLEETTYENHLANASVVAARIAKEYGKCKAVCESTGNMWIKSFEGFEKAGIPITLANTLKLKIISQSGAKTDKIDARVLARLLSADMMPACHVPERQVRSKKQILRHRISLVQDRTRESNRAGRLLDKYDVSLQGRRIAGAKNLKTLADATLLDSDDEFVLHQMVGKMGHINKEIAEVDQRIRKMSLENEDAKLIMSMPGLDAFGALLLALEIDGILRFKTPKHLVSWAGLCPTVSQSGKSLHYGRMRKDSNRRVNWMMTQAAHTAVRCDPRMKAVYERASKSHPHLVAISHVSHKMLTIIWHMLQNRTTYDDKNDALYARKLKKSKDQ